MDSYQAVGAATEPLLSICIPTWNRKERVEKLVRFLADQDGNFEVCVHDDGSADGTYAALRAIQSRRVLVSSGANVGRAGALLAALEQARGRYVMVLDDDDGLSPEGLAIVLADCQTPLSEDVVGFIYHLHDTKGSRIGSAFPVERSNFLAIRMDWKVEGDKKEVVLREPALNAARRFCTGARRVPTSLLWSHIALNHDVLCRNEIIGIKVYLEHGMTKNIKKLKRENSDPMAKLYLTHLRGFYGKRFSSLSAALYALLRLTYYSARVNLCKRTFL